MSVRITATEGAGLCCIEMSMEIGNSIVTFTENNENEPEDDVSVDRVSQALIDQPC